MTTASQWKLRRLAPRSLRVLERRANAAQPVRAFEATLRPVASEFMSSYDSVKRFNPKWQKEMREGRGAVANLITLMRSWLPRVGRDIPHFDGSTFADTAVPDDVMEDVERLLETVEEHQELATAGTEGVTPLAYADALQEELLAGLQTATKEWSEAEAADTEYQQALARTRELARAFEQELIAFRATLATTFGRSDTDYQKLRTARASTSDPDDDPQAPTVAKTPGAATPRSSSDDTSASAE